MNRRGRPPDFMNTNKKRLEHEQYYIEFLERRIKSSNFKKKVSSQEFEKTEMKLKKARLILQMLKK